MKKFLILFAALFIGIVAVYADTKTINWKIGDTTYDTTTCTVGGDLILPTAPTKYGYTFQGWVAYVPIEYIESNGTQWIDTGIVTGNDDLIINMDMQLASVSGTSYFIQEGSNGNSQGGQVALGIYSNKWSMILVGQSFNTFGTATTNRINFTWHIGENISEVTGDLNHTTIASNQYGYNLPWRSETIICLGTSQSKPLTKLYSLTITLNNTLVRDMIPVLDKDGVACMYDKVSGTFFYNAGTGNFVAGPVISE